MKRGYRTSFFFSFLLSFFAVCDCSGIEDTVVMRGVYVGDTGDADTYV